MNITSDNNAAIASLERDFELKILRAVMPPRGFRLMAYLFVMSNLFLSHRLVNQSNKRNVEPGFSGSKKQQRQWVTKKCTTKKWRKEQFGVEPVCPAMLSEIFGGFGDFENFVNVIGKDCGKVGSRVPGNMGAEGGFTNILGVLNIPDLWHAAPRSEGEEEWER